MAEEGGETTGIVLMTRTITIEVDELDESAILNAIAEYQRSSHKSFGETILLGSIDLEQFAGNAVCQSRGIQNGKVENG